ncbi:MAG: pyridoxal-phosphate dependent enzyme [Chloroflexota bacterium]
MPADTMIAACTNCGSPWVDAHYNYDGVAEQWQAELNLRDRTLWRYAELLPIADRHPDIWMGEGWTPLIRLHQYERLFGHEQIYVKDERQSPTSSFKDRQAALSVTALKRAGITEVVLASTGNAGVAYAAFCARAGIKLWLFVNSLVPAEKMREAALYGAEVIKISGTYDEAKKIAGEFAKRKGMHYDKGAKSVPGKESMKTIAFEMAEQLGIYIDGNGKWHSPDWYIQAVSGGIGPLGVWKGFEELIKLGLIDRMPKLGIIQAAGCAPMVNSHNAGLEEAENVVPKTLITVLATGSPGYSYRQLHKAVSSNGGAMVAIEDGTAFGAMRHLAARAGLSVEPATAVAFAGLEELLKTGKIAQGEVVIVNATGHTLPAESHILGNQYVVNLQSEDETETNGNLAAALESLDEKVTTVLVVDDNNNDRRLMRKLLRRYKKYRMLEAKSGVEALEVVRDRKPDLIVSDLMMPDMDGFGLLKNIKDNPETADIPVVVVSAKTLNEIEDLTLLDRSESLWVKGDFSRRDLVDHIVEKLGDRPISGSQPKPMLLQREKQPRAAVLDTPSENMHIVVMIDSKEDDVRVIQQVLEATGKFAVYPAPNGREGLKAVHEHQPDLVIMELDLSDMDGFTVAEKLANDTTLNHIPVVILTAKEVTSDDMMRMPADIESIYQKASLDRGKFLSIIEEKLS